MQTLYQIMIDQEFARRLHVEGHALRIRGRVRCVGMPSNAEATVNGIRVDA